MATAIKPKRGLESTRAGQTPLAGEITLTTDTKKIFLGDGSTAGGNPINYMDNFSDESVSGNKTFADNVIVTGNITVNGTATTVNSNTVEIGDNIMVLNKDEAGTPSQDAGIEIERGTSTNAKFIFNETTDKWQFGIDGAMVDVASDADLAALESYDQSLNTTNDVEFNSVTVGIIAPGARANVVGNAGNTISSSSEYSASYSADKAFDNISQSYSGWTSLAFTTDPDPWLMYEFGAGPVSIGSYDYTCGNALGLIEAGKDWTLEGSNDTTTGDDGTWTIVDTVVNEPTWASAYTTRNYIVDSPGSFTHYKMVFTDSHGSGNISVNELVFFGEGSQTIQLGSENIVINGMIDGRDISNDGAALDQALLDIITAQDTADAAGESAVAMAIALG
jgi:hypothetical protein